MGDSGKSKDNYRKLEEYVEVFRKIFIEFLRAERIKLGSSAENFL